MSLYSTRLGECKPTRRAQDRRREEAETARKVLDLSEPRPSSRSGTVTQKKVMSKVTSLALLVTLAGCAGGTIGVGGFSGGGGGGVGVGVSAPLGQATYVVSEGEQVIQPGMTSSEVIQRLGHPYYRFGVRQDNATILNYRMRFGSCLIYQVSILPNGIVRDAGEAADPACDVPDRGRW